MLKLHKKQLFVACSLILATALIIGSVAWFANIWDSRGSTVGITTGGNAPPPKMRMWMYLSENDVATDSTVSGLTKDQWVEQTVTAFEDVGYKIPAAGYTTEIKTDPNTNQEFTSYTYYASQLHFGKVDNLVTLAPDNMMYLRFEVDPIDNGTNAVVINFDYHNEAYDADPNKDPRHAMTLYKLDGAKIELIDGDGNSDNDVIQFDSSKREITQFLQFSYCVSTQDLTPSDAAFSNLVFSAPTPVEGTATQNLVDYVPTGETTAIDDLVKGQKYYVYIQISPKLETFGKQEKILDYFVPSYMLFDVKFNIAIH